jgi:2-polyprenyl-6-hydroxyphenyl methylase/3-demethylubiquinone-9 3-methyltransferase
MRKISRRTFDRMDNGVYDSRASEWWQPDSPFYQMKVSFNPARVGYLRRKLLDELGIDPGATAALDVGCGGGFLTEEVARMGFDTTGVDPSERSLQAAAAHARDSGLGIRYVRGVGESLPFEDGSFGAVFCCDVLEHVRDLPKVIAEVSRVLKPGGTFCFDTLNRTWLSLVAAIKTSTCGGCSSSPGSSGRSSAGTASCGWIIGAWLPTPPFSASYGIYASGPRAPGRIATSPRRSTWSKAASPRSCT